VNISITGSHGHHQNQGFNPVIIPNNMGFGIQGEQLMGLDVPAK